MKQPTMRGIESAEGQLLGHRQEPLPPPPPPKPDPLPPDPQSPITLPPDIVPVPNLPDERTVNNPTEARVC